MLNYVVNKMDSNNRKLEELMEINPELMSIGEQNLFLDELKKTQLYLPIEIVSNSFYFDEMDVGKALNLKEPLKFKPIKVYDSENNIILPLFTSSAKFKESLIESSTIIMHTEDLANMLNEGGDEFDEIMINPSSKTPISMSINSFLDLFVEDMFDALYEIFKLFEEKAFPLKEEHTFYLREKTPFMKKNSINDIFTSEFPVNVSTDANFNKEYPYLNILVLKEGMKILYIGNLVNKNITYDTILSPGIKFRFLKCIDENTLLWEGIV